MPHGSHRLRNVLLGAAPAGIALLAASAPLAQAAPDVIAGLSHASPVELARIFRRGRPPIYPYYYDPGPPGGWSVYIGPVPYVKGDYETQAMQRLHPEMPYPPSMRYWNPKEFPPVGD
jgi:hypothetical protein